jgi:hypothetical protein
VLVDALSSLPSRLSSGSSGTFTTSVIVHYQRPGAFAAPTTFENATQKHHYARAAPRTSCIGMVVLKEMALGLGGCSWRAGCPGVVPRSHV